MADFTINGVDYLRNQLSQRSRHIPSATNVMVEVWDILVDDKVVDTVIHPLPGIEVRDA